MAPRAQDFFCGCDPVVFANWRETQDRDAFVAEVVSEAAQDWETSLDPADVKAFLDSGGLAA